MPCLYKIRCTWNNNSSKVLFNPEVPLSSFPNATEPESVHQVDVEVAVKELEFVVNISFTLEVC